MFELVENFLIALDYTRAKIYIKMKNVLFIIALIFFSLAGILYLTVSFILPTLQSLDLSPTITASSGSFGQLLSSAKPSASPIALPPIPQRKVLPGGTQVFQTFNNCGPASLSMALSYFDITVNQQELGQALRPYQIPGGDNDDKSVTLEELAIKASEYGLIPYHRPNGTVEKLKQFIAADLPVITRTLLHADDDVGHYRVVKGYDDELQQLFQDDSMQGKDLWFSYAAYEQLWQPYNFEYLALVPKEKEDAVKTILGAEIDEQVAWANAVQNSETQLAKNPGDLYARLNLSVALYHTGNYQQSATEFEKVESRLPFRTLWYQIEPIEAYVALKNYDRVLQITDVVLNKYNRAFSELYLIRGEIYKQQGKLDQAKAEFEKAVLYNVNLQAAKEALASVE